MMMMKKNKLLVAVDFSAASIQALEAAISLCQQLGTALHVIYIADVDGGGASTAGKDEGDSIESRVLKDFKHQLDVLVEKMSKGNITFNTEVEYGDPVEEILRAAVTVNAEMIIMGTHGRTGLDHLLVGSVAESVLRKTTVPLLCVRANVDTVQK